MMKNLLLIGLSCSLSACSTYEENFDCPMGQGVRCTSLSDINKKMDHDDIALEKESMAVAPQEKPKEAKAFFGSEFLEGLRG